jgi:hypothetical protein
VFHTGWLAGAGREGVRMRLRWDWGSVVMLGLLRAGCQLSRPAGVVPRRGAGPSGPVAATKEENPRHGREPSDQRGPE